MLVNFPLASAPPPAFYLGFAPLLGMLAACVQLQIRLCQVRANLERALDMASSAIERGAEVVVFPELFLTGFCYERDVLDRPLYPTLDPFQKFVQEHGCMIIGSLVDSRTNLGFCLDSEGIGFQPKIHPFGPEKEHFDGGGKIAPVDTSKGKVALEICYDLRFPEVARSLVLQGADFLVTIAQFPASRGEHWRNLCIARAIENQIPHIACNGAGPELYGRSMIVDSWGKVLAEAEGEETLILAEIEPDHRDTVRKEIPVLQDRRPEVY